MSEANKTAIFSDLSRCQPADRLTREFAEGCWQLLDYETEDGLKGEMVSAFPEKDCGELVLPLEREGPHKIFLGINYTKTNYGGWSPYGQLEVKLSGDPGFRRVGAETLGPHAGHLPPKMGVRNEIYKSIQEACWKTADLSGKSLHFRQPRAPYNHHGLANLSNLSYVKLVPLSGEETALWRKLQPRPETRRIALLFCTDVLSGSGSGSPRYFPTAEDWFRDEMTPYLNCDIGILVLEALRGNLCLYPTKAGDVGTEDRLWRPEWMDGMAAFTRLAHENGIKIFAGLRLKGLQYPMNRHPIGRALNYAEHPEWAKRDREGFPTSNSSLAFPGVRRHWLELLRETLAYGIDGVQLHLNRSTPFVMYEEPVVTAFAERYGEDPRRLPENDPRWQRHCAEHVTQFLREVRQLLEEKPGRELAVTIYGKAHKYDKVPGYHPIRYNCDVETWLQEGLVDYLMPSPSVDLSLLARWREIGGPDVRLWPDLMPRTQPGELYAQLAENYYAAGADGLSLWDGERRPPHISEWITVQRLGHRECLSDLIREAPGHYRRVPLKTLVGLSVKESFHDG